MFLELPDYQPSIDLIVVKDPNLIRRTSHNLHNFIRKLREVKKVGFVGVELWHDDLKAFAKEGCSPEKIGKIIRDLGLTPVSYKCLGRWFDITEEEFRKRSPSYHEQCEFCAAVGANVLIAMPVHRYNQPDSHTPSEEERCAQVRKIANKYNVVVAIECNSLASHQNTLLDAVRLANLLGSSTVVDTFHLFHSRECDFNFSETKIGIVHVADATESTRGGPRLFPGKGKVPIKKILTSLWACGHNPPVSMGVYNNLHGKHSVSDIARMAYECFRKI
jgi:sugar phosphate isomerase/epimerase